MYKEKVREFKERTKKYNRLISECRKARVFRNYQDGLKFSEEAIALFPERFEAYQQRAYMNITAGKRHLSEYDFHKAIERCQDSTQDHEYWDLVLRSEFFHFVLRKSKESLDCLKKAGKKKNHWYATFKMGVHFEPNNTFKNLKKSLSCLVGKEFALERASVHYNTAMKYERENEFEKEMEYLERSLREFPRFLASLKRKSRIYLDGGSENSGEIIRMEELILSISKSPKERASSHHRRARLWILEENLEEAMKFVEAGLQLEPTFSDLHIMKIRIFHQQNQVENAYRASIEAHNLIVETVGLRKLYLAMSLLGIVQKNDKRLVGSVSKIYSFLRRELR